MESRYAQDGPSLSRRKLLEVTAGTATVGLAGCLAGAEPEDSTDSEGVTVVASFFTFYDFARQVAAGTPVEVENLVPVGMHGHGWEPDPSITRDIVDADAFVHVGENFQPWADRAIRTVRDDDTDTHLVNAREGVELLPLVASLDPEEEGVGENRGRDPHFWLDPTRASRAVDNITDGLVEVAPSHEATLRDNAGDLRDDLETIDQEWQAVFDAAKREVVFLAAHNAFQYVGERYGATIQPLVTNLAATDDVRPEDMRRARETITDHDIRYMGVAVFEPRRPARQLLEATAVEAYYPVTPYAGTTEAWVERGWGYLEIARNINMPTFEIVLGTASPDETDLGAQWRNFE